MQATSANPAASNGHTRPVVLAWHSLAIASILQSTRNSYSPSSSRDSSQMQSSAWSPSFVYVYGLLSTTIGVSWMFSPAVLGSIACKLSIHCHCAIVTSLSEISQSSAMRIPNEPSHRNFPQSSTARIRVNHKPLYRPCPSPLMSAAAQCLTASSGPQPSAARPANPSSPLLRLPAPLPLLPPPRPTRRTPSPPPPRPAACLWSSSRTASGASATCTPPSAPTWPATGWVGRSTERRSVGLPSTKHLLPGIAGVGGTSGVLGTKRDVMSCHDLNFVWMVGACRCIATMAIGHSLSDTRCCRPWKFTSPALQ